MIWDCVGQGPARARGSCGHGRTVLTEETTYANSRRKSWAFRSCDVHSDGLVMPGNALGSHVVHTGTAVRTGSDADSPSRDVHVTETGAARGKVAGIPDRRREAETAVESPVRVAAEKAGASHPRRCGEACSSRRMHGRFGGRDVQRLLVPKRYLTVCLHRLNFFTRSGFTARAEQGRLG